jgi:hypothetical protein
MEHPPSNPSLRRGGDLTSCGHTSPTESVPPGPGTIGETYMTWQAYIRSRMCIGKPPGTSVAVVDLGATSMNWCGRARAWVTGPLRSPRAGSFDPETRRPGRSAGPSTIKTLWPFFARKYILIRVTAVDGTP